MENFKLEGIETDNFYNYGATGFSFTTKTELDAYKAAYKYQGYKRAVVTEAPNVGGWLVQVYTIENEERNEGIGKKEVKVLESLCINPLKPYKELKGRSKLPNWIREAIKAASDRKVRASSYMSLEAVLNSEEDGYKALRLVEWEKDENGASIIADVRDYLATDLETGFIVKFFSNNANEEEEV